jgi:hypothetical protein
MTINLKVEEHIYIFFFIFKIFFCIYLEVHCQGCQINPLSTDPFSIVIIAIIISILSSSLLSYCHHHYHYHLYYLLLFYSFIFFFFHHIHYYH